MNIVTAAVAMRPLISESSLPEQHPEYGKNHMNDMINQIEEGSVAGEKAHRWLGYIQGCAVCYGGSTLEEVKQVNFKA